MRRILFAVFVVLLLMPLSVAEDRDGDGYDDPTADYTVWDGADAYPDNPDIHEPVFSTGCDPPVATLDLMEPVTFTCTVGNEGPVALNVLIDVDDDTHLKNQFAAAYYDINSGEILDLQVPFSGLSAGVAMARLRIFARANSSASHSVDLPIEVTGEEWAGMNSHSEGVSPPDISFVNGLLDDLSIWLSDNTPWRFDRMQAGMVVLIGSIVLIGTVRQIRARNLWRQNMDKKATDDLESEARFDALRRGGKHQHHIEPMVPESPEFVIKRK